MIIELNIHLVLLLAWHSIHDEIIIIFTDQCRSGFSIGRLCRRGSSFTLHARVMFESAFVSLLTITLQPSIAMSVLLSTRSLRPSWSSRSTILALATFILPSVPMILRMTVLALITMFAVSFVEMKVTKGLGGVLW